MKVLLVKPYNRSDHIQPSLGLGYLATSIRRNHDVRILDCIKSRVKPGDFYMELGKYNPDIVGIQCYTFDLCNVKEMLGTCRKRGIKTVLGGPHPSAEPFETMEFFGNDLNYLFQGEAEVGFKMLADKLDNKVNADFSEIPGLVWRERDTTLINEKYFVTEIDRLGMPAWDLIRPQEYPEAQHGAFFNKFPIAPIITTRGCPFMCTFCAGKLISGRNLRKRTPENVIKEIKLLYDDYGIREFHVIDDNFTLDKEFAKEFLVQLKKLNLDISWAVPNGVRVDTLDDEMLELMKETGLYLVSLGIESGSDRILKLMRKNTTVDKIREGVRKIRKHGIDIAGFFIVGFPGETVEDINNTIRFSLELDLIRANFFTYLPFPGTESFNELKRKGKLEGLDLKRFYFTNASYTPDGIDRKTLKSLQRKAFLGFFLRPGILVKNFMQVKSFNHFKFLFRRSFRWIG